MRRAALLSLIVFASACTATRQGRLYNVDSSDVLTASYKSNGSGKGPIWIGENEQAATCRGEYSTVAPGSIGWGTIFTGTGAVGGPTISGGTDSQGAAIITCQDGRRIECEFLSGSSGGHGACRDNRQTRYRLMF